MTPTASGPSSVSALFSPEAAAARASYQEVGTREPSLRTMGSVSRSSLLADSEPKRPLSQSHPWLTGSASNPSSRVSRFDDDCTATRQPTEQVVQVDSI